MRAWAHAFIRVRVCLRDDADNDDDDDDDDGHPKIRERDGREGGEGGEKGREEMRERGGCVGGAACYTVHTERRAQSLKCLYWSLFPQIYYDTLFDITGSSTTCA